MYRWQLGHHVAFCVWRLLAESLIAAGTDHQTRTEHIETAAFLYDVYSSIFLYAGSCTPESYARVIRERMAQVEPAFSGRWARDYEHVRATLGSVHTEPGSVLRQALKRSRTAHMAMALRLVPSGVSLLKQAGRPSNTAPTERERDILDEFFLTARAAVSRVDFTQQAEERIIRVIDDIERAPLVNSHPNVTVMQAQEDLVPLLKLLARYLKTAHCERKMAVPIISEMPNWAQHNVKPSDRPNPGVSRV